MTGPDLRVVLLAAGAVAALAAWHQASAEIRTIDEILARIEGRP